MNQQFAKLYYNIYNIYNIVFKIKNSKNKLLFSHKLSTKWTTQDSTLHMLMIY